MDRVVDHVDAGRPEALAEATAQGFATAHGRPPSGVTAAPGRANLIGEHTDYNAGLCLPVALPHATYAAWAPRDDGRLRVSSAQAPDAFEAGPGDLGPGRVSGWASYVAGVIWALRKDGVAVPGLDLHIESTVPVGAGLSSSAAIECSVALAAAVSADLPLDDALRHRLVPACMRAEAEVAGAPTGGLDQTISLFARPAHALLIDFLDGSSHQVPFDPDTHGVALVAVDTRAPHVLSDGRYATRRRQCEAAAEELGVASLRAADTDQVDTLTDPVLRRRAWHVVSEIARVRSATEALGSGDLTWLGELFLASHSSLRDDYEVSCAQLDAVIEAAMRAGALGARMTGGGFGGSAIALVPAGRVTDLEVAVVETFERRAWRPPGFLRITPSGGAREVFPAGA